MSTDLAASCCGCAFRTFTFCDLSRWLVLDSNPDCRRFGTPRRYRPNDQVYRRIEAKAHRVDRKVVATRIGPVGSCHPSNKPGSLLVRLAHHSRCLSAIDGFVNLLHSIDAPLFWSMNEDRYNTGTPAQHLGGSAPDDDRDVVVNDLSNQSIFDPNDLAFVKHRRRRRNIPGLESTDREESAQALEP